MGPTKLHGQKDRPKRYKCKLCDYGAHYKATLGQHMRCHSDSSPFVCSFAGCAFRSKYPQNLEQHERRHDPELSTSYKCPMCSNGYPLKHCLERHVRSHVKEELNLDYLKRYACEICNYRAVSQTSIDRHAKLVHSDKKPFACSFPGCQFRTNYPQNLEDHEIRHEPESSTRHKCPMCPKGFPFAYQLERHVRSHVKEKLYECSECEFKSVNRSGLRNHEGRRHGTGNQKSGNTT